MTETYGYSPVVRIPRGATHVRLTDNSSNYLGNILITKILKLRSKWCFFFVFVFFFNSRPALMDERERYFLNGNWIVDWPGRYETSGVAFHYERVKDSEVVHSRGPLQQDLIVMVCVFHGRRLKSLILLSFARQASELDALRLSSSPIYPCK